MVTVSSVQPSRPSSIFSLSQCGSGSGSDGFLTIGCIAKGFSPADSLNFKWKDSTGKELSDFVQYPAAGKEGDYTKISHMRVKKSDWDPKNPYKCVASNNIGQIESTLSPPVPPPKLRANVFLTGPTKMELDNGTATFMCLAQKFSPKSGFFEWYENGKLTTNAIDSFNKEEKEDSVTKYSAASILRLKADAWMESNSKVKCVFNHPAGNIEKEIEYAAPIQECTGLKVYIVPPTNEEMLTNKSGILKCIASADDSRFLRIEIKANNALINDKQIAGQTKTEVELTARIGYEEWINGTVFTCTVEHEGEAGPMHATFARENGKDRKRPSVYLLAPPENKESDTMSLTCYVKDFYPKEVFVTWLVDDEPAVGYKNNTSEPVKNDDFFSTYSQITVDYFEWKGGKVFTCVVYHESIAKKVHVLTRSITDNMDKTGVINLSMNTPDTCKQ